METRAGKLQGIIVLTALFLTFVPLHVKPVYPDDTDLVIDLFTQKAPYSGRGPGMPSDAFSPGETVSLYALVTDNGLPLQNLMVTFNVRKPNGESFTITQRTDENGISTIDFAISQTIANGTEVFGEWTALANVVVGNNFLSDSLEFMVDWIVKILSVRAIDENLTYRTSFGIGGDFGLEITVRNIAMCVKKIDLAMVVKDELKVPIIHRNLSNFSIPSNERVVYLYSKFPIPYGPHIGEATVHVSALTAPASQNGVSYCPPLSTSFLIEFSDPLTIDFQDAAILDIIPYDATVQQGQVLRVGILVRNEGTEAERFSVNTYLGDSYIGSISVVLQAYTEVVLNLTFDTTLIEIGNRTLAAFVPPLEGELDLTDNEFLDGTVEIRPERHPIIRDIAITDMDISKTSLYTGESLQINITMANEGTETETFTVDVHYNSSFIATSQIRDLHTKDETTLTFIWTTSQVNEGFYQIIASAPPVPDEVDLSDNQYISRVIEVKAKPPAPSSVHDVAVLTVTPSSPTVYQGDTVDVNITVANKGTFEESFRIIVYYDSNVAGAIFVEFLEPNHTRDLVFHWKTDGVSADNYTLSALAEPVRNEDDTADNYYQDGFVEVKLAPPSWLIPFWFWLFLIVLAIMLILLAISLNRRKRRRKAEESFYSGWTAWYYTYSPRDKL